MISPIFGPLPHVTRLTSDDIVSFLSLRLFSFLVLLIAAYDGLDDNANGIY